MLLRPGKTPSGREICGHLRRLLRAIREHWPHTHITIRGDSHYARPEVMEWCDENGIDFVSGLAGNDVLRHLVEPVADDVRVLASDRTSCRSALANQVRLVLHTAAYWLMLTVRAMLFQTPAGTGGVRHVARPAAQDRTHHRVRHA
jgi:hypothetical protein